MSAQQTPKLTRARHPEDPAQTVTYVDYGSHTVMVEAGDPAEIRGSGSPLYNRRGDNLFWLSEFFDNVNLRSTVAPAAGQLAASGAGLSSIHENVNSGSSN